jgi:hypothetical protein
MKRAMLPCLLLGALASLLLFAFTGDAHAQCAMCKASIQASSNGDAIARGLNSAIIVLLIPPASIFCAIFGLAFRHRKGVEPSGEDESE